MREPIDPKLVAFMTELADLLEKHDAEIDIDASYMKAAHHDITVGALYDLRLDLNVLTPHHIRLVIQPHLEEGGE